MRFAHRNPAVAMCSSTAGHSAIELADLPRLVSINTAIEVDLTGQVNSEMAGSRQLSGVGGSVDFVEAAYQSDAGRRITVLPSRTASGRSRIVSRLGDGAAVTTLRTTTDLVVTEHGTASLRGRTLDQRATALIAIAHPDDRDVLSDDWASLRSRRDRSDPLAHKRDR